MTGSIAAINMSLDSSANEIGHSDLPKVQFEFVEGQFPKFLPLLESGAGASQYLATGAEGGQGPIAESRPDDVSCLALNQNTRKNHFEG